MSAPDRTMDRDHRLFDRHTPVSIQMPDGLIEELPRDVSRLASLVLHSARKQPRPRRLTALPINRSFNGFVAHDPPGRAAVCGWGSRSCSWGVGLINLGWLGWMNFSRRALEKTGDHMNVPVDVASLVQQPAQVAGLRGSRRRRR